MNPTGAQTSYKPKANHFSLTGSLLFGPIMVTGLFITYSIMWILYFIRDFLLALASFLSLFSICSYLFCMCCGTMYLHWPSPDGQGTRALWPKHMECRLEDWDKGLLNKLHPNHAKAPFERVSIHWVFRLILSQHAPGFQLCRGKGDQWHTSYFLLNPICSVFSSPGCLLAQLMHCVRLVQ
jgi:hypothetical protein